MALLTQGEAATAATQPDWFASYPAGVPKNIDPDAYPSLAAMLIEACRQHAARPAFECLGVRMSYADWDRDSRDFAAFLVEEANCRPGDRVAIMMPNMFAYPVTFLGALRAGMIVVNVNPLYTPRELQLQLADSGATVIVIMENFAHKLESIVADTKIRHVVVARLGDFVPMLKRWAFNFANSYIRHAVPAWKFDTFTMLQDACDRAPSERYQDAPPKSGDVALLQYTGGTTGVPKGAMLTHRNLVANTLQCLSWIGAGVEVEHERVLTPLPLYHIFSLTANLLGFAMMGGLDYLIPDPRDLHRLIRTMRHANITWMSGVNTLFNALVNVPEFAELDFRALRVAVGGGAAIQSEVSRRWREITGSNVVEGYGLTEASPVVCINPFMKPKLGTVGLPVPSTEVSIRDDAGKPRRRRRRGRSLGARPASHARLLGPRRRNQKCADRRRLAQDRRHRRLRHRRIPAAARPQEGHDQRLRLQGLPERGGRRRHAESGRARSRRDRRAGRAHRAGGQALRRQARSGARAGRSGKIHARPAGRL